MTDSVVWKAMPVLSRESPLTDAPSTQTSVPKGDGRIGRFAFQATGCKM
ncbi:MAG: hypothetical protein KatS3mg023_1876 [Armatimonadota bacterium]|nr:MAG: hypothetical protein KatS3mg023_1876 [Armatimonadota bacterium]